MFKRLEQHLESNHILAAEQFGFRKDISNENAIFTFTNNVLTELNQRHEVGGIFCDLTKAFNCVNHNILLNKLYYYGIRGKGHCWLKSYLENRKQKVSTSPHTLEQENSSNRETITSGVLQVSILGPLLFIIYLNDLPGGLNQGANPVIYADDTSILLTANTNDQLKSKFHSTLAYMIEWFSANRIALNMEKTNIMKFTTNYRQSEVFQIIHQNKIVKGVNNIKFLGLELDKHVSWKNHIQKLLSKLSSTCYLARRMYACCNLNTIKMNFRFFIPCIFYMCYNKNYQQMRLFVLCLYFLFLVFSLHVLGFHEPIIRGISSCCFYATIWFMQCFVDRLRTSADCGMRTNQSADARRRSTKHCMNQMVA